MKLTLTQWTVPYRYLSWLSFKYLHEFNSSRLWRILRCFKAEVHGGLVWRRWCWTVPTTSRFLRSLCHWMPLKREERIYHKSIFRTWSNIPNGILSRGGCKIHLKHQPRPWKQTNMKCFYVEAIKYVPTKYLHFLKYFIPCKNIWIFLIYFFFLKYLRTKKNKIGRKTEKIISGNDFTIFLAFSTGERELNKYSRTIFRFLRSLCHLHNTFTKSQIRRHFSVHT